MEESWKAIEGYENRYQISNLGRVKSLNYKRTGKSGMLKPFITSRGYSIVALHDNKNTVRFLVHRLVASAFINKTDDSENVVNHKDRNPLNNNVNNLEWCTQQYNSTYRNAHVKRGLKHKDWAKTPDGLEHYKNKAKAQSTPVIGIHIVTGKIIEFESSADGARNGFNSGSICAVLNGKLKKHKNYKWFRKSEYNGSIIHEKGIC